MAHSGSDKLALFGGTPISIQPLTPPPFPPVYEETSRQLADLYLSRQWSFNGPIEQAFSQEYADYHTANHGIFMVNGTVTLQCALSALGVGPGDEVIVPANTWLATAMAARYLGAVPVFADVNPETLCLDVSNVEAAITSRTKAIIPVHLFGSMAEMDGIMELAAKHGLAVIEDCAHAQGGKWNGKGTGSIGHIGSFSFQQSKTVASGEGGICLTNSPELAEKLFRLKHIGYSAGTAQGQAASGPPEGLVCYNYRATEFQALILRSQLSGLKERIERYNRNAAILEKRIAAIDGFRAQARGRLANPQSYYGFQFIADAPPLADVSREALVAAFVAEGLPIGGNYGPVYKHLLWSLPQNEYRIVEGGCPVTENTHTARGLGLSHPWLYSDEATIETIGNIMERIACNADALRGYVPPAQ